MDLTVRPQSISNPSQTLTNGVSSTTSALTNGNSSAPSSTTSSAPTKMSKPTSTSAPAVPVAPRIEIQGFYDALKSALSKEQWMIYTTTLNKYLSGKLSRDELYYTLRPFLRGPLVRHHNALLTSLLLNTPRDPPPLETALWVSSPSLPPPSSTSPASEQHLKAEIMSISARERRRIKETPSIPANIEDALGSMLANYHAAKQIKTPGSGGGGGVGGLKTPGPVAGGAGKGGNWEKEILGRYMHPLSQETGEMPDVEGMRARLVPICYECGVTSGCTPDTAGFMSLATEIFVKEVLTTIISRVRSDGPKYVQTDAYRKRQKGRRRRVGAAVGEPEGKERPLLGMHDMRLSLALGDNLLCQLPLSMKKIMAGGWFERDYEVSAEEQFWEGDEEELGDLGWEGADMGDRKELRGLLDECLANGL